MVRPLFKTQLAALCAGAILLQGCDNTSAPKASGADGTASGIAVNKSTVSSNNSLPAVPAVSVAVTAPAVVTTPTPVAVPTSAPAVVAAVAVVAAPPPAISISKTDVVVSVPAVSTPIVSTPKVDVVVTTPTPATTTPTTTPVVVPTPATPVVVVAPATPVVVTPPAPVIQTVKIPSVYKCTVRTNYGLPQLPYYDASFAIVADNQVDCQNSCDFYINRIGEGSGLQCIWNYNQLLTTYTSTIPTMNASACIVKQDGVTFRAQTLLMPADCDAYASRVSLSKPTSYTYVYWAQIPLSMYRNGVGTTPASQWIPAPVNYGSGDGGYYYGGY